MSDAEGLMGKLILLRRVREEREREALARAARVEDEARSREQEAERRLGAAADELSRASQEQAAGRPAAQVIQLQGQFLRRLRALAEEVELQAAARRGERIAAVEAAARVRAELARMQRAREQLEERLEVARRERRRARELAEEARQNDAPRSPR